MTDDVQEFKNLIKQILNQDIVTVVFTKLDGDVREMTCTTNIEHIPPSQLPVVKPGKKPIKEDADSTQIRVYDINAQGWRSFLADRVISYKVLNAHVR